MCITDINVREHFSTKSLSRKYSIKINVSRTQAIFYKYKEYVLCCAVLCKKLSVAILSFKIEYHSTNLNIIYYKECVYVLSSTC